MRKAHAEHNEQLCDFLIKHKTHYDWVITTAFYAAIHFVEHKLFPCTYGGNTFMDIDEAHGVLKKGSRHVTRQLLVDNCLPNQAANYLFLDKNCRNARYVNYAVSLDKAMKAKQRLEQLKKECLTEEVKADSATV
jgi:hypothetical protein